jgi:hypothetical protein
MIRVALAAGALALAAACGVKGRTFPPELVQPKPPTDLVGKSTVDGLRLMWKRPTSYSGGQRMRDLGGFDVERATGADGIDFAKVATVEVNDQTRFRQERTIEWIDTSAEIGTTYRYRVVAYTLDGYRSAPAGPLTIARGPPPAPAPPAPSH